MSSPSELTLGQKKYLTVEEAADYLHITKERVLNLITSGELAECVKTDTTDTSYSISVDVLDKWFDGEAYENKIKSNSSSGGDENTES